jgi:hypothetical protein
MKPPLLLILSATCLSAVTPAQVDAIIGVESSGNPAAVGRLGERGLCQFFPAAWADTSRWRRAHGLAVYPYSLAHDLEAGYTYATSWLTLNEDRLRAALGRQPTIGELYAAHQLGFAGFRAKGFDLSRCPTITKVVAARLAKVTRTK